MKILISSDVDNPYMDTLFYGLQNIGREHFFYKSSDLFWEKEAETYDIIHVMWAEDLIGWKLLKKTSEELKNRLDELKSYRIRIVTTCHDMIPHHIQNEPSHLYCEKIKAYEILYEYSDMVIHLGENSLSLFKAKYKDQQEEMIPINVLDEVYEKRDNRESRERFRQLLKIPSNEVMIISVGRFRNSEELVLMNRLSDACVGLPVKIFAPSMYASRRLLCSFGGMRNLLGTIRRRWGNKNIYFGFSRYLSDEEIAQYCCAGDIGLIQRVKINNSGGVPLNMYFGNVVVGPNVGNVGDWIQKTGNVYFDVEKHGLDLREVIEKAIDLVKRGMGEKNRRFALERWNTKLMCEEHIKAYERCLMRKANKE